MEKIINELRYFNKSFPREALTKAMKMKEEITPILLEELDEIIACPEIVTENQDYMLHIYAIYLLAQFREKKAFARVIDLISFKSDEVEVFLGDVLTGDLSSIIYSTFDGDLNTLQSVIENPLLNIYARSAALDVYAKLYSDGAISKEECMEYLRGLIYDNCYDIYTDLATCVQGVVIEKHFFEMIDDIQLLYDQNRIDTMMFGQYDNFIDCIFSYEYDNKESVRYIEDVIKEMYWWSCFEKTEEEKRKKRNQMRKYEKAIFKEQFKEGKYKKANIEKPKKIGRNDPCPCGSGKKYKKCCLGKKTTIEVEPKKEYSESAEEQKNWLKYYPIDEGERRENEVRITDMFDRESIDIDKLVYLALHYRAIPIWIKRDRFKEEMIKISYLIKAYEKFLSKSEKEGISSFDEYDSKYKIHYRSKEWIERLEELICENDLEHEYEDILGKVNRTISKFS